VYHGVTHALVVSSAGHRQSGVGLHPDQSQICWRAHQCSQTSRCEPCACFLPQWQRLQVHTSHSASEGFSLLPFSPLGLQHLRSISCRSNFAGSQKSELQTGHQIASQMEPSIDGVFCALSGRQLIAWYQKDVLRHKRTSRHGWHERDYKERQRTLPSFAFFK